MYVMKSPVLTVGPEATLEEAYKLLLERGIRHLPVVEEGRLVGIVTDRDIRLATSHLNPKGPCPGCTRVGEVMTREVKVDALNPWSTVVIWYCSIPLARSGSGSSPVIM